MVKEDDQEKVNEFHWQSAWVTQLATDFIPVLTLEILCFIFNKNEEILQKYRRLCVRRDMF